ncbi:MAG: MOSC domain-containing protein [Chromatiaceae bacterium]|nr:MOSC domain-containing protein [Chromatiaceae bacterium]
MSAISKTPVTERIKVNPLGLEGDEQADLSVHGGLSKAIYAYPSEHYAYWREQLAQSNATSALPFGSMGENLTIFGLLEQDVFVGDELRFRDCVLRITQPRLPCFKLNAVMKDKLAAKKMAKTGFCGFYLSVVSVGSVAVGEKFQLIPGARQTSIETQFKVSMRKMRN